MAGETTLAETFQDEVNQLLEAHLTIDTMRDELIDELEHAVGNSSSSSKEHLAVLSQGLSLLSEESDDQNALDALMKELRRKSASRSIVPHFSMTNDVLPDDAPAPLTKSLDDISNNIEQIRQQQEQRIENATATNFFNTIEDLLAFNAMRSASSATQKKLLDELGLECLALSEEVGQLRQVYLDTQQKSLECNSIARELRSQVKAIHKTFADRSRFGAWVCDKHAKEEENEAGECPGSKLLKEGRLALHVLKAERRDLIQACEDIGCDLTSLVLPKSQHMSILNSPFSRGFSISRTSSIKSLRSSDATDSASD